MTISTVRGWEAGRAIEMMTRQRLAIYLERHLATPEGEAFARSLDGEG